MAKEIFKLIQQKMHLLTQLARLFNNFSNIRHEFPGPQEAAPSQGQRTVCIRKRKERVSMPASHMMWRPVPDARLMHAPQLPTPEYPEPINDIKDQAPTPAENKIIAFGSNPKATQKPALAAKPYARPKLQTLWLLQWHRHQPLPLKFQLLQESWQPATPGDSTVT